MYTTHQPIIIIPRLVNYEWDQIVSTLVINTMELSTTKPDDNISQNYSISLNDNMPLVCGPVIVHDKQAYIY